MTNDQPEPIFQDMKGNPYEIVLSRERRFRHDHPNGCIKTEMISADETRVVFKASVYSEYHENVDGSRQLLGVGHAEETRGDGYVNADSAIENCETSAKGRALDSAGYNCSGQVASFEEGKAHEGKRERRLQAEKKSPSPTPQPKPQASEAKPAEGIPAPGQWGSYHVESVKVDGEGQNKNGPWKRYKIETIREADDKKIIWTTFGKIKGGQHEFVNTAEEALYHGVLVQIRGFPSKGDIGSMYWDMYGNGKDEPWMPWKLKDAELKAIEANAPIPAEVSEWIVQELPIRIHPDAKPDRPEEDDHDLMAAAIPAAAEPAGSTIENADDIPF